MSCSNHGKRFCVDCSGKGLRDSSTSIEIVFVIDLLKKGISLQRIANIGFEAVQNCGNLVGLGKYLQTRH